MKIIPKLNSGGGMPPFNYYTPVVLPESTPMSGGEAKASGEGSTKGQVTDKDLFEMLSKVDGLPKDMESLIGDAMQFYQVQNLYNPQGQINTSRLSNQYLSLLYKLKVADYNKKEYDKAYQKVNESGGLNEAAITSTGKIVVRDLGDNSLKDITSQEYLNNSDKYQVLTNSNLLALRAESPEFAYKNEILDVVGNGIGIPSITKMISDTISNLGTNTFSNQGYSYKEKNQIIKGLEILQEAQSKGASLNGLSLDGMYKNKLITKDQYQQAAQAIQYIYSTLPTNAKTLLELRSNNTENPRRGALDLITQLVTSKSSNTIDFSPEYEDDLDKNGKSKSNSKNSGIKSNPLLNVVEGKGGEYGDFSLNVGSGVTMSANSINYTPHSIQNSLPISTTSLENMLVESGLLGIVSQNGAITFGDQVLNNEDLKNIVYRGNGYSRVILPTRQVDGKTIPDFTIMDEYLEAQKEIDDIPQDLPKEEVQKRQGEILYKHGLLELLDLNTGLPNFERFKAFIVADAYGADKDDLIKPDQFVEEVDSDDKIYENIEKILSTKDYSYSISTFGSSLGFGDKVYKGVVYIPINNNKLQSITAYGDQVDGGVATQLETDYQTFLKKKSLKSTSSDVL